MKYYSRINRPPSPSVKFGPSLVQPQFARDTDINVMIQRYLHGDPSVIARHSGIISDATSMPDSLHDALNIRARGELAWAQLPEHVRASYGNVERFLDVLDSYRRKDVLNDKTSKSEQPVATSKETSVTDKPVTTTDVVA